MTALFDPAHLDTLTADDLRDLVRELAAQDEAAAEIPWSGVICIENVATGDGRFINPGVLTWRDLPLPLMLQTVTAPGHDGAVICGRIETITRDGNNVVATGMLAGNPAGQEAADLITNELITGVSVDMDDTSGYYDDKQDLWVYESGQIMGATLTPFPAFKDAQIGLVAAGTTAGKGSAFTVTKIRVDQAALVAAGTRAGKNLIPVVPPAEWFTPQEAETAHPIRIGENGRIFGYVADWRACHLSYAGKCRTAPHSQSGYSKFLTGTVLTSAGPIATGRLLCKTVHPKLELNASDAEAWYHDTGCCFADVTIGEDQHGIWVAGAVRPDTAPETIRAARGSDFSPDWRPIQGKHEMVAILAVNVSGFIVDQALVASGAPDPTATGPQVLVTDEGEAAIGLGIIHQDARYRELRADMDRMAAQLDVLRPLAASILLAQTTGQNTFTVSLDAAPCACRKHS